MNLPYYRVDVIATITAAQSIYAALGFKVGAPCCYNPIEGVVYHRRGLADLGEPGEFARAGP